MNTSIHYEYLHFRGYPCNNKLNDRAEYRAVINSIFAEPRRRIQYAFPEWKLIQIAPKSRTDVLPCGFVYSQISAELRPQKKSKDTNFQHRESYLRAAYCN